MRRRNLLQGATGLLAAPALAQPAKSATLRFVPQANLTLLDPVFTTATVTSNHGYYVSRHRPTARRQAAGRRILPALPGLERTTAAHCGTGWRGAMPCVPRSGLGAPGAYLD